MNGIMERIDKTPIEIVLGVDENGMTTAKKLYAFLELAPQHYARWCKSNVTENEFAEENIDYFPFTINGGMWWTGYNRLQTHSPFCKETFMQGQRRKSRASKKLFF